MQRRVLAFLTLMIVYSALSAGARAQAVTQLMLKAGQPGSDSFQLGVGLTSLIKVIVLPREDIDLDLTSDGKDMHLVVSSQTELEAILASQPVGAYRSVMTFRTAGINNDLMLELVAREDVSADVINSITKAISENGPFLNTINERAWDLSLDQSLQGSELAIHPGALRYYQKSGGLELDQIDNLSVVADKPEADQVLPALSGKSTFFIYFNGDDERLDAIAEDQIQAACKYASMSASPLVEVSSYKIEPVGGGLSAIHVDQQRELVIAALGQEATCPADADVIALDDARSALPVDILGKGSDRVEITITLSRRNF